ncbi:MAG TPA: hydroxymethylbilane synthase, partial [Allosphingosinicella sp.]
RRAAQILARRPDLQIVTIRGNVQTRLAKLERGEADATLLAAAGLDRLGMGEVGTLIRDMLPAPAQGAVGIEVRSDDEETARVVAAIDHLSTHRCIAAERKLLEGLGGNCRSPVAALATCTDGIIRLRAEILTNDGSEAVREEVTFHVEDAESPLALAHILLNRASPALRALFNG